ncbi:hypothetical protein T459_26580 [Capsicum annuum]|uniref:Alpha-carbonic anhydrase domain-containing protein n=1 Tax=Capsicum annuum TaxID=4072 RepID=A0A2G2YP02_CAPAN|nr:alpha carbonic anhydrase 4 isoform X1 [Capsicum annuum]PHT71476.1 hypothetical protein T459_26580 [Capsicum annuum]
MAKTIFFPVVLSFIFILSYTMCINANATGKNAGGKNEVDDEKPFSYLLGTTEGPYKWGTLKPNWKICDTGLFQSPINFRNKTVKVTKRIPHFTPNYKISSATIMNRGHDIKLQWEGDAGSITLNGTVYKLIQCHWHTPSEHKVDGQSLAMEAHLIHQSVNGKLTAVIGILFNIGPPNPFLNELIHHAKTVDRKGKKVGLVDPNKLGVKAEPFYRYIGSLTVPPCTEGIVWNVLHQPRTVSMDQMMALRNAVNDGFQVNARPTQGLRRRPVYLVM